MKCPQCEFENRPQSSQAELIAFRSRQSMCHEATILAKFLHFRNYR